MISLVRQSRNGTYGLNDFVVDVEAEIAGIQLGNSIQGSSATVIATSNFYLLNSQKQWILQSNQGGGGGGGGTFDADWGTISGGTTTNSSNSDWGSI